MTVQPGMCKRVGLFRLGGTRWRHAANAARFSAVRVGAYRIRPIKRHPTDGEYVNRANYHDSSFHKWNVWRAYAIRPYITTLKRGAFCTSILGGTLKRGAFCTSILDGALKRGAFCTSYLVATPKRGAFCTSYLVATPKRGVFCTSYQVATPKRGAFCTSYLVATLKRAAFSSSQVGAYCIRPTNGPLGRKSSYTFDHRRPFFYP